MEASVQDTQSKKEKIQLHAETRQVTNNLSIPAAEQEARITAVTQALAQMSTGSHQICMSAVLEYMLSIGTGASHKSQIDDWIQSERAFEQCVRYCASRSGDGQWQMGGGFADTVLCTMQEVSTRYLMFNLNRTMTVSTLQMNMKF